MDIYVTWWNYITEWTTSITEWTSCKPKMCHCFLFSAKKQLAVWWTQLRLYFLFVCFSFLFFFPWFCRLYFYLRLVSFFFAKTDCKTWLRYLVTTRYFFTLYTRNAFYLCVLYKHRNIYEFLIVTWNSFFLNLYFYVSMKSNAVYMDNYFSYMKPRATIVSLYCSRNIGGGTEQSMW